MLGAYLENIWGPKRFFIFYIFCALGSFALYNIIGVYEIEYLKNEVIPRLEGGFTSGYETWYKGWVADLQGNHSEEESNE